MRNRPEFGFEWNERKAETNLRKHGISFDEAATAFSDDDATIDGDLNHSDEEDRFMIIGRSESDRLITVAFTFRREETVRIISARRAEPHERRRYEEKIGKR